MKILILNLIDMRRLLRGGLLLLGLTVVTACVSSDKSIQLTSENYNSRVRIIVIHHTSENFEDSLNLLTRRSSNSVSSHYLIPEPSDETYNRKKLEIFELVPEAERAWHAGRSYWAGKSGLNDQSIGIELVNQTYCHQYGSEAAVAGSSGKRTVSPRKMCFYPDFAESQIDKLIGLLGEIRNRHPDISPTNILGHSDIAPDRKIDPGPRFPWQRLYQLGYGAWFDDETVISYWEKFMVAPMPLVKVQKALKAYGYNIEATGTLDEQTQKVLRAFQMHFRPSLVSSAPDLETVAILFALVEKYRSSDLAELLGIVC